MRSIANDRSFECILHVAQAHQMTVQRNARGKGVDPRRRAMGLSLAVSFVMLVGKLTAYFLTGSAAIFSDAAESVVHLLATAFVGFSLWYAFQPPDAGHPYGHGKIAYFSSGLEGLLIIVAAVAIVFTAVEDLILGATLARLDVGLLLLAVLTTINLALGLYVLRVGRRHNNLVLISNGQHVLTDVWTSVGVLIGIGLVWMTNVLWLDPLVAILVAFNIMWTGFRLMRQSVAGLMERADDAQTSIFFQTLEKMREEGIISNFHQLRHRRVHDHVWVEYHLLFPDDLSITEAHDRSHLVEESVVRLFPEDEVFVTAHLEPDHHERAHPRGHVEPADPLGDASVSN